MSRAEGRGQSPSRSARRSDPAAPAKNRASAKERVLASGGHRLYRLAPDLLLVFKPHGHHEGAHEHERSQRLRVLRGTLVIHLGRSTRILTPRRPTYTIAARRVHRTEAREDTWLVVEWS